MKSPVILALAVAALATAASAQDAAERGHVVFQKWCSPCHAPVSGDEKLAGTSALALKYNGQKPAALEQRTDLPADQVKFFVRHGVNAMPSFRKTEISDLDLTAVAAYVARNTKP